MQHIMINAGSTAIALYDSGGIGQPVLFVHGNSSSAKCFAKQFGSDLTADHRLLAIDLPGHGQSPNAVAPEQIYSLPGYARVLTNVVDQLGLESVILVGWSLGGHIVLEAAPDVRGCIGMLILGTPPLGQPPDMASAFLPHPAMALTFQQEMTAAEAESYALASFSPSIKSVPREFVDDVQRTDGRARAGLAASAQSGNYRDEVALLANTGLPVAILHGTDEQLVNLAYLQKLNAPTLWRGAIQVISGAGHTPQWEAAPAFNTLLHAFVADCHPRS